MVRIKGFSVYLSAFLAALTCPCHVPLYLFLFSGTSLGVFLTENEWLFFIALGMSFPLFGLLTLISFKRIKAQHIASASKHH